MKRGPHALPDLPDSPCTGCKVKFCKCKECERWMIWFDRSWQRVTATMREKEVDNV